MNDYITERKIVDFAKGFDVARALDLLEERGCYQSLRSRRRRAIFRNEVVNHLARKVYEAITQQMLYGDSVIKQPKGLLLHPAVKR